MFMWKLMYEKVQRLRPVRWKFDHGT